MLGWGSRNKQNVAVLAESESLEDVETGKYLVSSDISKW